MSNEKNEANELIVLWWGDEGKGYPQNQWKLIRAAE
jgi:hypothetical protein